MNKFTPLQKRFIHILHEEGDKWRPHKQWGRNQPVPFEKNGRLSWLGAIMKAAYKRTDEADTYDMFMSAFEKLHFRPLMNGKVITGSRSQDAKRVLTLHETTFISLHNIAQLIEAVPWMFFSNFKTPTYLVSWNGVCVHEVYGKPDLDISQVLDSCTPPQWRSRMDRAYKLRLESLSKEYSE